jgi:hypothetical protein
LASDEPLADVQRLMRDSPNELGLAAGILPPEHKTQPASFRTTPIPPQEWIVENHSTIEIAVLDGSIPPRGDLGISRIGVENIRKEFTGAGHASDDQPMNVKAIDNK